MISDFRDVGIGSFSCVFGDMECRPEDIPGFKDLWHECAPDSDFEIMGCGTFRKMSAPVEGYVADCVTQVLERQDVPAKEVDRLVIATADGCLGRLPAGFAVKVLTKLNMTECSPVILSFQQCCSSLEALRYARTLFADPEVQHVVVVAMDFSGEDSDRVRSFALFSDAVAGFLVSRDRRGDGWLRMRGSALKMDSYGLLGQDSFVSRQEAAQGALARALGEANEELKRVVAVFPSNLYEPLVMFNAMAAGISRTKLHFTDSLHSYAHSGNCDWIVNLTDYAHRHGMQTGELFLAQASAPGFSACSLLEAT